MLHERRKLFFHPNSNRKKRRNFLLSILGNVKKKVESESSGGEKWGWTLLKMKIYVCKENGPGNIKTYIYDDTYMIHCYTKKSVKTPNDKHGYGIYDYSLGNFPCTHSKVNASLVCAGLCVSVCIWNKYTPLYVYNSTELQSQVFVLVSKQFIW